MKIKINFTDIIDRHTYEHIRSDVKLDTLNVK